MRMPPDSADPDDAETRLAQRVRDAATRLMESAYTDAGVRGLCGEGAFEYALDRLRHADPADLLSQQTPSDRPTDDTEESP